MERFDCPHCPYETDDLLVMVGHRVKQHDEETYVVMEELEERDQGDE